MSKQADRSSSNRLGSSPPDELSHIPLLKILSTADRQRVLQDLTEQHYTKREVIFREGDPTEYFHIVKEGTVKCVKSTPEGKECTLKMLMPGDLFCCDAAAFEGSCHPGTAQPMGDVSILRMNKKAYFEMLRRNPEAALEVIKHLGNRLNEAKEKAKILALDRTDQRLAALLVDLATVWLRHADFYLVESYARLLDAGFDDLCDETGVLVVEWPARFPEALPGDRLEIRIDPGPGAEERQIRIAARGERAAEIQEELQARWR